MRDTRIMRGNPGALSALLAQAFDVVRMKSPIGGIQLHRDFDGNPVKSRMAFFA